MVEDTMFSGESKNIEYKVSLPDKSEKYMKTIVAFCQYTRWQADCWSR
mgnify:CR=1 FL=1